MTKNVLRLLQESDAAVSPPSIAFTVTDEKTFEREVSALRNIRDHYPKYLLTLDFDSSSIEGIQKINVIDWLMK